MGVVGFSLPRHGPFALKSGYRIKEILKGVALGALMIGMGALMAWLGGTNVQRALHISKVWSEGVPAQGPVGFDGRVKTTNLIFKDYDLQIQFRGPDAKRHSYKAEFMRFFSGPSQSDPIEVRYMANAPDQATSSWENDARGHIWVWAILAFGLMLLMGLPGLLIVGSGFKASRVAMELAEKGTLVEAPISSVTETVDNGVTWHTLECTLPGGGSHVHRYTPPKQSPWLNEGETAVLVMVSMDESEAIVLRHDGHPFEIV